ncbi:MAG: oxidoreductase [Acidobacteria bacterium]|nr:oxidoreductase [Acidobacteriota bacterium]
MFLSELNFYPVKSLGAVAAKSALITNRGLEFDRRRMLVDEKNKFLSQREFPEMARFRVTLERENLQVSYKGTAIEIPLQPDSGEYSRVKIWSSSVKAENYQNEINEWFSASLRIDCRLVLMPEDSKRIVEPFYAVRKFKDAVSFADAYPFLLTAESSLLDLNEKLEKPISMNRFRPNLVVSGAKPFEEDSWKKIKIGNSLFHVVKSCARCVITTVDQENGVKDGVEPLRTLSNYRNKNGKVLFGRYLIAEKTGETIKIGDKVEIVETARSARTS